MNIKAFTTILHGIKLPTFHTLHVDVINILWASIDKHI